MADIRIKDLATTATTTASDDFMAVDGAINGTRKMNAAAPAFLTSVTTPSLTSPASTNLTLGLGTGGTALTLANSTLAATFAGALTVAGDASIGTNVFKIDTTNTRILLGLAGALQGDTLEVTSKSDGGAISLFGRATDNGSTLAFRANGAATLKGFINGNNSGVNIAAGSTVRLSIAASAGDVSLSSTTAGSSGAGALVVSGGLATGADSFFGGSRLLAQKDQNAPTRIQARNDNSGTSAQSQVSATLGDFTTYTAMGSLSAGFTTSGLFAANSGYIASNATAGLNLFTVGATSLTLGTNSTAALTLASGGAATFAGAVTVGGKITSAVSTATGYNQLYDTTGLTTGRGAFGITSTGAGLAFGVESSVGGTSFTGSTAYASYFGTTTATPIHFVTNSVIRQTIDSTGAATFAGAVTAASLATAQTAAAATSIVITHKIPITLNGTVYYMALTATP